jgi:hypothetical protein
MTWWALATIGTILIWITQVVNRVYGLCLWPSYIIYILICAGFTGWMSPLYFEKAPTFFQPYFFTIAGLSILGYFSSVFYFKESISAINLTGAAIALIGAALIGIGK